ncbi:hypothetical protein MOD24_17240 [Bacillus haynesii]|uniref:hypothetical protein n=1 Tax=Bacillus haynesii TaxID=1925021 RepID=UPI00227DE92E|nr:hypothetical protein [Bacillus haynesii]MCY8577592.1 hypothetical protein [Bacillus haynesii]MEC1657062.1 hypothetical protein [Bacillus haynesii]
MNLENSIKDVINQKLEDGTVNQIVEEQFVKGVNNSLESLFSSYGDVTRLIEKQLKSVIIPYLENFDYSRYITKLDGVLTEVLKTTSLENKKMLENFKELMPAKDEVEKTIKVTDLFDHWMKYVASNVQTDGLDVCFDDEPTYEDVDVSFEVIYDESSHWSSFEYARIVFECKHDENMNVEIKISRMKKVDKEKWDIDYKAIHDIRSLRHLDEFEVLLMKLTQNRTKLILDSDSESNYVQPEEIPEPSYS